jgi:hypothetical protein
MSTATTFPKYLIGIKPVIRNAGLTADLHHYAQINDTKQIKSLITKGANANYFGTEQSPLCWSIFYRNEELSLFFIDHMTINALNYVNPLFGQTALHKAISMCCPKTVEKLIERDVDLYQKDADGLTPYDLALHVEDKAIIALIEKQVKCYFCRVL